MAQFRKIQQQYVFRALWLKQNKVLSGSFVTPLPPFWWLKNISLMISKDKSDMLEWWNPGKLHLLHDAYVTEQKTPVRVDKGCSDTPACISVTTIVYTGCSAVHGSHFTNHSCQRLYFLFYQPWGKSVQLILLLCDVPGFKVNTLLSCSFVLLVKQIKEDDWTGRHMLFS